MAALLLLLALSVVQLEVIQLPTPMLLTPPTPLVLPRAARRRRRPQAGSLRREERLRKGASPRRLHRLRSPRRHIL